MGKIESKKIYVVAKGLFSNKVFLDSEIYSLIQTTTDNLINAKWFEDYDKAEHVAKKANGEVYEFVLIPAEQINNYDNCDIEEIKNENKELKAKLYELQEQLKINKKGDTK